VDDLVNKRWDEDYFLAQRPEVLGMWHTGREVDLEESVSYHKSMPHMKNTAFILRKAKKDGRTCVAFRGGVATIEGQIELLQFLQEQGADILPATCDSYTRNLRFKDVDKGIEETYKQGRNMLNGFPAVNLGVSGCRKVLESVDLPITCKHGSVDGRILAEVCFAGGMTDYNGGGICFNVVYSKNVPMAVSLKNWQYIDRLIGYYAERGVIINREESGALTGTLVPPCISISIGIIEALLAAEQGVEAMDISYGQGGNIIQDIAAIHSLNELGDEWMLKMGYDKMSLTSKFDQWMGAFPYDENTAYGVIVLGAITAALGGAQQTIVKSPQEAMGVPTKEANAGGIRATRQAINMVTCQKIAHDSPELKQEKEMIRKEVNMIINKVYELGNGDLAIGVVNSFEAGVLDVPFAPSLINKGRVMPIRDGRGALRFLDHGNLPFDDEIIDYHKGKIAEREKLVEKKASYTMVVEDVFAISKGYLVDYNLKG
jgi:methylaspartate mutase epsilon subunit